MTPIDDETLMAFADGELPEERRLEVEQALAADAQMAARLAPFLASARLLAPLDRTLEEPLPPALASLAAALSSAEARGADARATIGPGDQRPQESPRPMPAEPPAGTRAAGTAPRSGGGRSAFPLLIAWLFGSPRGLAAAATAFALGSVIGLMMQPQRAIEPLASAVPAADTGQSALRQALASAVSGAPVILADEAGNEHRITPQATMRTDAGQYCREYLHERRGSNAGTERGIACAAADGSWQVMLSMAQPAPSGDAYRPASAGLAEFDALAARIAPGQPLSPDAEREAMSRGWIGPPR